MAVGPGSDAGQVKGRPRPAVAPPPCSAATCCWARSPSFSGYGPPVAAQCCDALRMLAWQFVTPLSGSALGCAHALLPAWELAGPCCAPPLLGVGWEVAGV